MTPLTAVMPAAASGVLTGLAVRAAWPGRPDLTRALDRLDARSFIGVPICKTRQERFGACLSALAGGRIALPLDDLKLLGVSPGEHLARRVLLTGYGLVAPQLLFGALALAGTRLPYTVLLGVSLLLGAVGWQVPGREVGRAAIATRLVVRHAAASYAQRVVLAGPGSAHTPTAHSLTGTGPAGDEGIHVRLREVFDGAARAGATPWQVLKQVGDAFGVPELTRLPDALPKTDDQAAVRSALRDQARDLRNGLRSEAREQVRTASVAMLWPVTLGVALLLAFVAVPIVSTLIRG